MRIRGPGPHSINLSEGADPHYQSALAIHWTNYGVAAPAYEADAPAADNLWLVEVFARHGSGPGGTPIARFGVSQRTDSRVVAVVRCPGTQGWHLRVSGDENLLAATAEQAAALAAWPLINAEVTLASSQDCGGPAEEHPNAELRTDARIAAAPAEDRTVLLGAGQIVVGWAAQTTQAGAFVEIGSLATPTIAQGVPAGGAAASGVSPWSALRGPGSIRFVNCDFYTVETLRL